MSGKDLEWHPDVSVKHHRLFGWSWLVYICLRFARGLAGECLWCLWRTASHPEHHLRLRFHPGGAGVRLAYCFSSVSIVALLTAARLLLAESVYQSEEAFSLRVRNLDAEPIKVNDKTGNPIMIGMVLVWKLKDTYKAIFEIDTQTMAEGSTGQAGIGASAAQIMNMLGRFVQIQADAALRQVAGQYAYDDDESGKSNQITLRDGSDEINKELEARIDERLAMAGIEVVEARINYLAYAPEIAAVMLRRPAGFSHHLCQRRS